MQLKVSLAWGFIPSRDIAISITTRLNQNWARQEGLDGQGFGQAPAAEVECLHVHIGCELWCLPHCLEALLRRCRLRGVGAVLRAGGPDPPLSNLSRAVPADVDVGGGAVGFGVTPNRGLVNWRGCPVELESTVVADTVGSEIGVPDWVAVLGVLGHGRDNSPSNKGVSIRKNLHATLTRCGKSALGSNVLVQQSRFLGRCVDLDDHTSWLRLGLIKTVGAIVEDWKSCCSIGFATESNVMLEGEVEVCEGKVGVFTA